MIKQDYIDTFREITFRGFTGYSKSLVLSIEKNSIVLIIGWYMYEENIEYV